MKFNLINMAKNITNVTVDKISLLTKDNAPAVEGATFRLFKMFSKNKFTKEQKARLEKLAE